MKQVVAVWPSMVYKWSGITLGIPESERNLKLNVASANKKATNWKWQLRKREKERMKVDWYSRSWDGWGKRYRELLYWWCLRKKLLEVL